MEMKNKLSELREQMGLERRVLINQFLAERNEEEQLRLVREAAEGWNWDADTIEALAYSPHVSVLREILELDTEGWALFALIVIASNAQHEGAARYAWLKALASMERNDDGSELEKLDSAINGLVFINFSDRRSHS